MDFQVLKNVNVKYMFGICLFDDDGLLERNCLEYRMGIVIQLWQVFIGSLDKRGL